MQARQYVDGHAADLDVLAVRHAGHGAPACCCWRSATAATWARAPSSRRPTASTTPAEVLSAFVSQYYAEQPPPREIVLDRDIADCELLAGRAVGGRRPRACRSRPACAASARAISTWSRRNAELALATRTQQQRRADTRAPKRCATCSAWPTLPQRIECFDISHTMGEATVASCVVFDAEGAVRSQYRRYNIAGIEPGDDYAAMHQALERRFRRAVEEGGVLPDILLIDGGNGQVAQARAVLADLGIDGVVAGRRGQGRGASRRARDPAAARWPRTAARASNRPALQLIQQVRDEAHRFAITGHRGRRQKARSTSRLEDIAGIGPRRRASLLKHFGGLAGLKAAGVEEIARVEGINAALAERIYATLHGLQGNVAANVRSDG